MADAAHNLEVLEALLLTTDRPLTPERLTRVVPGLASESVAALVTALNDTYERPGRSFRVRQVAGGFRLYTLPEYQPYVDALAVTTREARLSQAALETLAVVAYRQPVSRPDIEYVRGCDCDAVLRTLLARKLVAIKGRSDAPGRPLLYATTDRFLEYFGLARIGDLPDWSEIAALVGDPVPQARLSFKRAAEGRAPERTPVAGPAGSADPGEPSPPQLPVGVLVDSGGDALPPGDEA